MRRNLEVFKRQVFQATYVGSTLEPQIESRLIHAPSMPLVLLEDIECDGEAVSDHNWYPYWGAFELSDVSPGDRIQFLATPTPYLKKRDESKWWAIGFSQLCWVQKSGKSLEALPVVSPPETQKEAEVFLSRRMSIAKDNPLPDYREWGCRVRWDDKTFQRILNLVNEGWASFSPWFPILENFQKSFLGMDELSDREITRIADIAAWCNAGFPGWECKPKFQYQPNTFWRMESANNYNSIGE